MGLSDKAIVVPLHLPQIALCFGVNGKTAKGMVNFILHLPFAVDGLLS